MKIDLFIFFISNFFNGIEEPHPNTQVVYLKGNTNQDHSFLIIKKDARYGKFCLIGQTHVV